MKADPTDQQRLLDLAAEDVALTQLDHRRRTLPEAAAVEAAEEAERTLAADLVRAETDARDLEREVTRMESDVDVVRQRAARDQQRLDAGSLPAREVTALQHELESLARRQGDLEDQELELMEQVDKLRVEVTAEEKKTAATKDSISRQMKDLGEKSKALEMRLQELAKERKELAEKMDEDLLNRFERLFASKGDSAIVAVEHGVCTGCHMKLTTATVKDAEAGKEIVNCEQCGRILYIARDVVM